MANTTLCTFANIALAMNVREGYKHWAKTYDTCCNPTRDLDNAVTKTTLSKYVFSRALELGCGTGKNTEWLLSKGVDHVMALDFSPEMLDSAKHKISDERVTFKRADLNEKWLCEEESVDLVTSSLTLEHIEDLQHIFTSAHNSLVSGGIFFISELHPFKQYTGSKARFETDVGGVQELTVFLHHTSEYLRAAESAGFDLSELNEWFHDDDTSKVPKLISFVFRKKKKN